MEAVTNLTWLVEQEDVYDQSRRRVIELGENLPVPEKSL